MGHATSKLVTSISNLFSKPKRAMVVGLDAAGKTTIFFKLKFDDSQNIPVIGFGVETTEYKNFQLTACDLGGQKIRPLLRHFYESSDAVVFVFDSHDRDKERCELAAEELHGLSSVLADDKPILIFANKQDLGSPMDLEEIKRVLHADDLKQKNWHIRPCSATKGDGLHEGLLWLNNVLQNKELMREDVKSELYFYFLFLCIIFWDGGDHLDRFLLGSFSVYLSSGKLSNDCDCFEMFSLFTLTKNFFFLFAQSVKSKFFNN